jgi:hypothetical protein
MNKKVFISHSCKDAELRAHGYADSDPADIPDERLRRLRFTQIVRDSVFEALSAYAEPKLDRACLQAGDEWPLKLKQWLAECQAGVIFLTPEALESDWVLTETTILCWRHSLDSRVKVFPVWLSVDDASLQRFGFKPTEISRIQRTLDYEGVLTTAGARDFGFQIAEVIRPHLKGVARAGSGPVDRWAGRLWRSLFHGLKPDPETVLDENTLKDLDLPRWEDLPVGNRIEEMGKALGYGLLLGDASWRVKVIKRIADDLSNASKVDVLKWLSFAWVSGRAAAYMLYEPEIEPGAGGTKGILIRINRHPKVKHPSRKVLEDHVKRASCEVSGVEGRIIDLTDCIGEHGPENSEWLKSSIDVKLEGYGSAARAEHGEPVYCLLNRWPTPEALADATGEFRRLRCVLVLESNVESFPGNDGSILYLEVEPPLTLDSESHREQISNLLQPLA